MATPAAWAVGLLRLGSVPFAVALVWASIAPEAVASVANMTPLAHDLLEDAW